MNILVRCLFSQKKVIPTPPLQGHLMYPLFVLGFLAVRRHCAKISLVIIHLAVSQPRSLAAPLVTLPATVAVLPPSTAALALAGAGLGGAGLLAGAGLGAAAASKEATVQDIVRRGVSTFIAGSTLPLYTLFDDLTAGQINFQNIIGK